MKRPKKPDDPQPAGEASKPGRPPTRLKIEEGELGGAITRILKAGKPDDAKPAKKKRRKPR